MKSAESTDDIDQVAEMIGGRAENLFLSRQLLCAGAVLTALNQGLAGGVPPDLAVRLTSGMGNGLGGSGCICGALNGGVLAMGLFLGDGAAGVPAGKVARKQAAELHDIFRERFSSTCCRVLTKNIRHDRQLHYRQCAKFTGAAAEITARLILRQRKDLLLRSDQKFLSVRESLIASQLKKAAALFFPKRFNKPNF